jgi:2-dehydropantoate 2-reductase
LAAAVWRTIRALQAGGFLLLAERQATGDSMKACVFGAGAVGGNIAARLLAAGADEVSVVARGAQLDALRTRGLVLRSAGRQIEAKVPVATDDPSTLPPQDLVFVTLKAHAVPAAARAIAGLLAPQGSAVFMLNGIQWWWRHGRPGATGTLPLLDPDGALWNEVRPERAIGCVIYCPCDLVEPGVIVHTGSNHFLFGEPDGTTSDRVQAAAALFQRAGIDGRVSTDLRREIWTKLVSNASGNTISALTRQDLGSLGADPALCSQMIVLMQEVLEVAAALGWDLRSQVDPQAIARRGAPGQRPSMLQDVLQGRPIEVEALFGQVHAFAREAGVAVPTMEVLLPVLRGLDRSLRGR